MNDTFTIIFFGLISHLDLHPGNGSAAVLLDADNHKAVLCVSRGDLSAPLPSVSYIKLPNPANVCPNEYEIDLRYANVKFNGLAETRNTYTEEYRRHVPSLTTISGCRVLKSRVRSRSHTAGSGLDPKFSAYVDYPGGMLDVDSYYANGGELKTAGGVVVSTRPQCYACRVRLTMTPLRSTVGVTITKYGVSDPLVFDVRTTATLTVKNRPVRTGAHFGHHYDIFDDSSNDCTTRRLYVSRHTDVCDLPTCPESTLSTSGGSDGDVECSNTNYP